MVAQQAQQESAACCAAEMQGVEMGRPRTARRLLESGAALRAARCCGLLRCRKESPPEPPKKSLLTEALSLTPRVRESRTVIDSSGAAPPNPMESA